MFRWFAVALAALSSLSASAPASAKWYEARSKHFVIYADSRPEKLQDFATKLERFDQGVRAAIKAGDPPVGDGNRLAVYVMPSAKDVQRLVGDTTGFLSGFYTGRARGPLAFVAAAEDASDQTVFFHEYTHHLMMQQVEMPYPEWYVEGFAEFFSTPKFDKDGSVWFGAPAQGRAYDLFNGERIPIRSLLGSTYGNLMSLPKEKRQAVYAWSWLLSHFLLLGSHRDQQLTEYVRKIGQGVPLQQATESSFGDLDQLQREVENYRTKRLLQFKIPGSQIRIEPIQVAPLNTGAAAIVLARGELKYADDETAAERLLPLLRSTEAQYPGDELVETTLAEAELDVGNAAAAQAAAVRASKSNPRNTEAMVLNGRAIVLEAKAADIDSAHALFEKARSTFIAANTLDSEDPEPLMEFYSSFISERVRPTSNAIAALHYASNLAPQDLGLRMNSAIAYVNEGKLKEARATLAPVAYWPHADTVAEAARKVISLIDAGAEPRSILRAAFGSSRD